jgi:Domain of unknown function (DUF6362)
MAPRSPLSPTIIARLEEAGTTLLAMRLGSGAPRQPTSGWPEVVHEQAEAYGWNAARMRPAIPDAAAISRMDEALGWIGMIPGDRYVLRRIVGARALVNPRTQRHLYSWRQLGRLLHADYRAVQRWHSHGIELIAAGLARGLPIARQAQDVAAL